MKEKMNNWLFTAAGLMVIYFSIRNVPDHPVTPWHNPETGELLHRVVATLKPLCLYGAIIFFVIGIAFISIAARRGKAKNKDNGSSH
jgi:hypothetical protein